MTPSKLKITGIEIQNQKGQAQYLHVVVKDAQRVSEENEKLRLQLAFKTKELKHEENQRLKLELALALKTTEIESLRKLRAKNEHYKKTAKPPRVLRLCRSCNKHVLRDYRNCPMRQSSGSFLKMDSVLVLMKNRKDRIPTRTRQGSSLAASFCFKNLLC